MSDELMKAVHQTITEHGYKDLTIAKIAQNYSKGKSNIYHHYNNKEELMLAFLEHLKECMGQQLCITESTPSEELDEILGKLLGLESQEAWEFRKAILEMKSEAPYNEDFAQKITGIDKEMRQRIQQKLNKMDVSNSDVKSELILSAVEGTVDRKLTMQNREGLKQQKEHIKQIIDLDL